MSNDELVGKVLDGRYTLHRRIGGGGMGAVYEASDEGNERLAIKVIHREVAQRSATAIPRFLQEATASRIDSLHVVPVLASGHDQALSVPYLVMTLLAGESVEGLIERVGAVEPRAAVAIISQAARGLAAAHQQGIIHRDIKPANLFLHREHGRVVTRVCDFGIAKLVRDGGAVITATGHLLGTPLYMSPEQTRNAKKVDERSDVWSLGVTLYQLLTGRLPHEGISSLAELMVAICHRDPPQVDHLAPWVDPALAAVVRSMMARELSARLASADEVIARLAPLGGEGELTETMLTGVTDSTRSLAQALVDTEAAEPQKADPLLGTVLGGRFRLLRLLGRGGMGAVYEASGPDGASCAIKLLVPGAPGSDSDEARRRLLREARAAATLHSEHAVRVVEADDDPDTGVAFIVMELLQGVDLDRLLARVGALDPQAAARLFSQACRGLSVAHAASIVHRDIKPANLFLHEQGEQVCVKLCDFGIAKQIEGDGVSSGVLTGTGAMLGSPVYMSPEQARNARLVDSRSDLWSLCISMYQALTGRRPWSTYSAIGEIILAICTEELPPLASLAPWLDPDLVRIVERGLRRQPSERWTSADELRQALLPFTGGSELLDRSMLRGLPPERRAARPVAVARTPDEVPPSRSPASGVGALSSPSLSPRKPAPARLGAVLAGGGLLALLTGAALLRSNPSPTPPLVAAAEPPSSPPSSPLATSPPIPSALPVSSTAPEPAEPPPPASAAAPASGSGKGPPSKAPPAAAGRPSAPQAAPTPAPTPPTAPAPPGSSLRIKDHW